MTDNNSQTIDTKQLIKTINASPLSEEDKAHWLEILPKLNEGQKKRLLHSLQAKIDVAAAKTAIDKALKIIDQAEAEAEEEIEKEEKTEQAVQEVKKEAETNPTLPEPEEVSKETLPTNKVDTDQKLQDLRSELAQISQEAHGATPPSYSNS